MKSYIQGLITGGVFVFAFMVLMGSTDTKSEVGTYQLVEGKPWLLCDTRTGTVYKPHNLKGWQELPNSVFK